MRFRIVFGYLLIFLAFLQVKECDKKKQEEMKQRLSAADFHKITIQAMDQRNRKLTLATVTEGGANVSHSKPLTDSQKAAIDKGFKLIAAKAFTLGRPDLGNPKLWQILFAEPDMLSPNTGNPLFAVPMLCNRQGNGDRYPYCDTENNEGPWPFPVDGKPAHESVRVLYAAEQVLMNDPFNVAWYVLATDDAATITSTVAFGWEHRVLAEIDMGRAQAAFGPHNHPLIPAEFEGRIQ